MFAKLTKYIDAMTVWIMKGARWLSFLLLWQITLEVFMRYVFNHPTLPGGDLQTMNSAVGRMIGIGYADLTQAHVIMDVFTLHMPFRRKKGLELFNYIAFFYPLMFSLMYTTWGRMLKSWKYHETMYTPWRPPVYPIVTVLFGCYLLMLLQGISETIKHIISLKEGNDEWIKDR